MNCLETDTGTGLCYIKESLANGAAVPLTVTGSSMMPLLKPQRDFVWLEPCDTEQIRKGDIVLFERDNGKPVLHRVRKVEDDGTLLMNGDALFWSETIEKNQIVACVKRFERNQKIFTCDSLTVKLWNMCWHVTRPFRSVLRKIHSLFIKKQ